jgi:hypothetical protein
MLQPAGADHDVAWTEREKFPPLLGHGVRQVAVAMRALGRSGDLDLDDQKVSAMVKTASLNSSKRLSPRSAP